MFIITIGLMRLMGKSSIVQLTPYDLVAIFIIGSLVAEPFVSTSFIQTLIRSVIVVVFYMIFARLTLNQTLNKFLLGEPSLLIKHGKIVEENLEREHISLIQLLSILRTAGYAKLTDVNFAILEPTGSISVIPQSSARPVTLKDLDIDGDYEGIPIAVIIDGKIQKRNLKLINQDEQWLMDKLQDQGVKDLKQIIYAFADEKNNEVHINLREDFINNQPGVLNQQKKNNPDQKETEDNKEIKEIPDEIVEKEIELVKDTKVQINGLKKARTGIREIKAQFNIDNFKDIESITIYQKICLWKKNEEDK